MSDHRYPEFISTALPPGTLAKLNEIAVQNSSTRSQLMRTAVARLIEQETARPAPRSNKQEAA